MRRVRPLLRARSGHLRSGLLAKAGCPASLPHCDQAGRTRRTNAVVERRSRQLAKRRTPVARGSDSQIGQTPDGAANSRGLRWPIQRNPKPPASELVLGWAISPFGFARTNPTELHVLDALAIAGAVVVVSVPLRAIFIAPGMRHRQL
jgi:hypothetical protein